jgi:secretory phospholipase A2
MFVDKNEISKFFDVTTTTTTDSHVPTSNGCGPAGMQIESKFKLESCCDKHDLCYDTCGKTRTECDKQFESCMNKICKSLKSKSKQQQCQ